MLSYETYIFDIDGTLLQGSEALPGAIQLLQLLRTNEKKILFVTNTPVATNAAVAKRLHQVGIDVKEKEVITPIQGLQAFLCKEKSVRTILGLIDQYVRQEIAASGWDICGAHEQISSCSHVLLGMHNELTYNDLTIGLRMIDKGAKIVLLNGDLYCPIENGRIPDTGAISAVFEACSCIKPISVGKPSVWLQYVVKEKCESKSSHCLFIGDSPISDLAMGHALGMDTVLLKTGVTKYDDKKIAANSTYEFSSLTALLQAI
ncbi:HAD-IIA family hydrolase [Bacillus aquiflavi]|uniref:HAD-IIA family hydrolase n=1 Tax=Bacillus aquiflavi TaxID=2672567 RepID=A0A6B3VYW1_9BACI|nr:HAD-IIA family hydrolase [Bacillus aquiflavi]MBA4537836.1 HAD-IIA family hydrolase [Bacillus aquiflavi]NEY82092.1 HAD-IIA family hydrolase [Bacillus aquiflavi]UAC48345.1 HAD-IIA family hydrolase [Bacillus aquiflavi]